MSSAQSLILPPGRATEASKRKKQTAYSMELPERFRADDEEEEEVGLAADAVTPPGTRPEGLVQQSMYGVIAAAHSRGAVHASFHLDSGSDSEPGEGGSRRNSVDVARSARQASTRIPGSRVRTQPGPKEPRQRAADNRLNPSADTPIVDHMTHSQILPSRPATASKSSRQHAPMLDRKIQAQARASIDSPAASTMLTDQTAGRSSPKPSVALPQVLAEIFQFEEREEVIEEYACWYLQSVLLQGYMYITQKHVCFYAYLQKKGSVVKSGYLGKQGKRDPRYRRYWFSLKGDVLSYHQDINEPYFTSGSIDLRFSISAELAPVDATQDKNTITTFTIVTDKRTFHLQADSASSAKEWVRQLQKVVFRSHNDSDSVKIALSLDNIVDVEPTSLVDAANTIQIRAMDSQSGFAVDEYYFTFFNKGEDALNVLKLMTKDNELSTEAGMEQEPANMSASQVLTTPTLRNVPSGRHPSESSTERPPSEFFRAASGADAGLESRYARGRGSTRTTADLTESSDASSESRSSILPSSQMLPPDASAVRTGNQPRNLSTLQHAYTIAEAVRNRGLQMRDYLSSSPREYYDRFAGAIAGGRQHYSEGDAVSERDRSGDSSSPESRFRAHFSLPETEKLRSTFYCWLHRVLPLYGKVYVSDHRFCFRSLIYGTRTKLIVPFDDIDNVRKEKGFRWGYPGMVLVIGGHEELFFDFGTQETCDDCVITILRSLDVNRTSLESIILTEEEKLDAAEAAAENELLQDARKGQTSKNEHKSTRDVDGESLIEQPILFDDPNASILDFRPQKPLRITCLTIGSRGDVQPYIALCKGLLAHGHQVKIATHVTFKDWVEKHGIQFAPVDGDPAELMRLCVELGMFTPSFIYETGTFAREWLDRLLETSWKACQNSDVLIESPSAMAGIHIAEALAIPYFRAFTMPWTKTRAFPHAFATTNERMGGRYNYMTYIVFENVFWQMTAGQINRWRRKRLHLGPTDLGKLQLNKVPFLYNFSPSLVVPPLDFSDWIRITGYWFLEEAGNDFTPPADLLAFINKARADNMKLVYIGFGSIPVSDTKAMTQQIIEAVAKADVRCIFSKGWSDAFDNPDEAAKNPTKLPDSMFHIRSIPHDWLFKQIDCAVHHGGSGTTGASLRAGVPTVIKPFFGDQFFFAARVEDRGVGIHLKKITAYNLGKAIWIASHDQRMLAKARELGEKIRAEDGVHNAINAIYRDLEYAKTLVKTKQPPGKRSASTSEDSESQERSGKNALAMNEEDDGEESWTFVEDVEDVDVTGARRIGSNAPSTLPTASSSRPQGILGYRMMSGRRG